MSHTVEYKPPKLFDRPHFAIFEPDVRQERFLMQVGLIHAEFPTGQ